CVAADSGYPFYYFDVW
nr:immunoglobulin heavy chain junction region [Macaca mulatta]